MEAESSTTVAVDVAQIVYRRIGKQRVQTGIRLSLVDSRIPELVLPNNRGIGDSTDDGQPFDIAKLAAESARVIETLGVERPSVLGSSMGGSIAQALALNHADRVDKLVLSSTDPGGVEADLASPDVWSELIDASGTPNEQARRLLFLLFPTTWRNPFIANSAISWQRRARNYPLSY
jgi:pimeloyl-ACP methyl ester carboxylesterase